LCNPSNRAQKIAESDSLRSHFVRKLVKKPTIPSSDAIAGSIPRLIVQFWNDFPNVPDDVNNCLDSWRQLESAGYRRQIFDDGSADAFISDHYSPEHLHAFRKCYHPAMRSDYFRLCYIYALGGCYIDADDAYTCTPFDHLFKDGQLKLQPLCYDCESHSMVDPAEFTDSQRHSRHWIYYFNNNPIIAGAGHPVVGYALRRAMQRLLQSIDPFPEIQTTTGPGNMTVSVVARFATTGEGIISLANWGAYSQTVWSLSYRRDERNWRLSNARPFQSQARYCP